MVLSLRELPRAAWLAVISWTLLTIVISVGLSVALSDTIMRAVGQGLNDAGLAASVLLPVLVGGPIAFYHLIRQQQLKLANQKLQVLASTDWLTATLNRRAFTHQVTSHLTEVPVGAFLVIDADHFKMINDHYGHDRGDEVLQLMATTIKANLREGDLVGRIGGEEFGVYLKGTTHEAAKLVAERIRKAVEKATFMPDGAVHPLSVSVGGAFYDEPISFTDLFRIADQRLYGAKQSGRNRSIVGDAGDPPSAAAA